MGIHINAPAFQIFESFFHQGDEACAIVVGGCDDGLDRVAEKAIEDEQERYNQQDGKSECDG